MTYKDKILWKTDPTGADSYRKNYVEGIQNYICKNNKTSKAERNGFMPPEKLVENSALYRNLYRNMLGLDKILAEDTHENVMTYIGKDDLCTVYRLTVHITKEIPMYALLLIPHIEEPAPLVIAQHGGGGTPELCCNFMGKNNYNNMVQRLLERGAAVVAPQLLLWSLNETETMRKHDIPYDRRRIDNSLKRFGTSVTALEIAGIIRCIDYVSEKDMIDSERISMTGISYGGYFTLYTMAADERIKAGYAAAFFNDRDIYDWSDWCYPGSALVFQDAEVAALCAPRKLYISVGKKDEVFDYKTAIPEAERVKKYFDAYECPQNYVFKVWDGGHTIMSSDKCFDFIFSELK